MSNKVLMRYIVSSCCRSRILSFLRRRESSFQSLDPCFRRGDIGSFYFPQQELIKNTPLNPLSRGDLKVSLRDGVLNRFLAALGMTKGELGMTG